jgi:hypothetical protein
MRAKEADEAIVDVMSKRSTSSAALAHVLFEQRQDILLCL